MGIIYPPALAFEFWHQIEGSSKQTFLPAFVFCSLQFYPDNEWKPYAFNDGPNVKFYANT
jgi:hypothetical protein